MTAKLEELDALVKAATETPWQQQHTWSVDGPCTISGVRVSAAPTYAHICDIDEANDDYLANAALIVWLVNNAPAMLRAQAEEIARLEKERAYAVRWASTSLDSVKEVMWRYEDALKEIRDRHIPDQPMADDSDEATYARKHHTELRNIARAALGSPPDA